MFGFLGNKRKVMHRAKSNEVSKLLKEQGGLLKSTQQEAYETWQRVSGVRVPIVFNSREEADTIAFMHNYKEATVNKLRETQKEISECLKRLQGLRSAFAMMETDGRCDSNPTYIQWNLSTAQSEVEELIYRSRSYIAQFEGLENLSLFEQVQFAQERGHTESNSIVDFREQE